MHQKVHGSCRYQPKHYCPGRTCTRDRKIYTNSKRKNQGDNKYITIQTIATSLDCGNCIQHSILAKLLSPQRRHTQHIKACSYRLLNWGKTHFLSHFDDSCLQLSLYQPAIQEKNKPFEWLGRVISFNRIFQLYQKKVHLHAKSTCECFLYI